MTIDPDTGKLIQACFAAWGHAALIEKRHDIKVEFTCEDASIELRMSKSVTIDRGFDASPEQCCCIQHVPYHEITDCGEQTIVRHLDHMVGDVARAITYA